MKKRKTPLYKRVLARFKAMDGLSRGLLIAFSVVGLITAVLAFNFARRFIVTTTSFELPGLALSQASAGGEQNGDPNAETAQQLGPELEPWDGASRVTILVMGLDYRDWEAGNGPPRTDSLILLTIDPITKQAGMLSVPRDLWVEIPGFGHQKINTAYQLGEGARLPGGGAGLAVETVENFLGITINYYARIDFSAFERFIDTIGGVKITTEEDTYVQLIGDEQIHTIQSGTNTLNGEYALAFARARHTENGDFDRSRRQQQLILAIRNQLLRPDVQGIILSNGLNIYQDLSSGIHTNMGFQDALRLGLLALDVNVDSIQRGVISFENDMVIPDKSPDGLDILKPITENIRILRDEIFTVSNVRSQLARSSDSASLMLGEAASVAVYNGSNISGLADSTREYLATSGMNIVATGNADTVGATTVFDYTGNPYTVAYLVEVLGIQPTRIYSSYDPNSQVDVEVILGPDWTGP